jgi:hypothetical protein
VSAKSLLDRVHSRAALGELNADEYKRLLAADFARDSEVSLTELERRDVALRQAIADIDDFATRVMRIHLDHVLADDTSIPTPTRKVFASTIVGYANNLALLEDRARRHEPRCLARDASSVAAAVIAAANDTLALRDSLISSALQLVHDFAQAAVPEADKRAKDRTLDDASRKTWSAARRELEALVVDPARVALAPWAARLVEHPEQIDEPPPEAEVTFADMIELD